MYVGLGLSQETEINEHMSFGLGPMLANSWMLKFVGQLFFDPESLLIMFVE